MRNLKIIFILFVVNQCYSQTNIEQKSFDYFFTEIIKKEFPDAKKIKFSGYTEKQFQRISSFLGNCLSKDEISRYLKDDENSNQDKLKITDNYSKNVRFTNGKRPIVLSLYLSKKINLGDRNLVCIEVVKKNSFGVIYFFLYDNIGNLNSWCKISFMI